jgi:hypothetical protein
MAIVYLFDASMENHRVIHAGISTEKQDEQRKGGSAARIRWQFDPRLSVCSKKCSCKNNNHDWIWL